MPQKVYLLPKLDDLEVLQVMRQFRDIFEDHSTNVIATIGIGARANINLDDDLEKYAGKLAIENVSLSVALDTNLQTSLVIRRENNGTPSSAAITANWDYSTNNSDRLNDHAEKIGEISTLLNGLVRVVDVPTGLDSTGFNSALSALTAQHQEMMSTLHARINELEDDRTKWSQEKAEEQERQAAEINRQKDEIDKQRRQLQLDSPRAERRKILGDFTDKAGHLAEDVSLGERFVIVRLAVFSAAMVSGVIFAIIALSSVYAISGGTIGLWGFDLNFANQVEITQNYVLIAFLSFKSAISTAISIGSFLLGINWLKSLQNEEARNARVVSRFKRDLIRASWIIETVQEIRGNDGNASVPDVWLERATHGMFDNDGIENEQDHSDSLKALLSNSNKLSVGPNGITAEYSSKGAKNLAEKL